MMGCWISCAGSMAQRARCLVVEKESDIIHSNVLPNSSPFENGFQPRRRDWSEWKQVRCCWRKIYIVPRLQKSWILVYGRLLGVTHFILDRLFVRTESTQQGQFQCGDLSPLPPSLHSNAVRRRVNNFISSFLSQKSDLNRIPFSNTIPRVSAVGRFIHDSDLIPCHGDGVAISLHDGAQLPAPHRLCRDHLDYHHLPQHFLRDCSCSSHVAAHSSPQLSCRRRCHLGWAGESKHRAMSDHSDNNTNVQKFFTLVQYAVVAYGTTVGIGTPDAMVPTVAMYNSSLRAKYCKSTQTYTKCIDFVSARLLNGLNAV